MSDNTDQQSKTPEPDWESESIAPGDKALLRYTWSSRQEAYESKRNRMFMNRQNFNTYNLQGDFSHKLEGQSKEFLPKTFMAVEQLCSFMQQAMIDSGKFFSINKKPGVDDSKLTEDEMTKLLMNQMTKVGIDERVVDALKLGALGSLMILKVHGEYVKKPKFTTRDGLTSDGTGIKKEIYRSDKEVWELRVSHIRQEDYFPDPTGDKRFEIQQIDMDLCEVKRLATCKNPLYDIDMVNKLTAGFQDTEQLALKARETGQNMTFQSTRKRCRIWECYGDIIDPTTGDVIATDMMWSIANDVWPIQKPTKIPFWHGKSPIVAVPIIRVPTSVWHKALMDAPVALNNILNEIFNLELDRGLMSVWGIRQIRPDWLADETQISEGITPGMTLEANSNCPPGEKVLEPIQTTDMTQDGSQTYNLVNQEFNQAAMTNDLRMGSLPDKQIRATEVVEASQTITSMTTGIVKMVEEHMLVQVLEKAWMTMAQNMNDMDSDEIQALLGKARALAIHAMGNEEMFVATAQGFKFTANGISRKLAKNKNFQKFMTLMQTITPSEPLMEAFVKKYDFSEMLDEMIDAIGLDMEAIELPSQEIAAMKAQNPMGGGAGTGGAPNNSSQTPQAGAAGAGGPSQAGGPQPAAGGVPQAQFPPSRATPSGGF